MLPEPLRPSMTGKAERVYKQLIKDSREQDWWRLGKQSLQHYLGEVWTLSGFLLSLAFLSGFLLAFPFFIIH